MRNSPFTIRASLTVGLLAMLLASAPAKANPQGEKVIRLVEQAFLSYKDQFGKYKYVIKNRGGDKIIKFTLYNKGTKRLLKFTYPGDVRGQMVLMQSKDEMYIYLPAYRRVRRLAGHVRNQGFMGSDLSLDDVSIGSWSKDYTTTFVKQDAKYWYLSLKKKAGRNPPYPRLKMRVLRKIHEPDKIEYMSRSGRALRTQTLTDWYCQGNSIMCAAKTILMVDHRRGNHKTYLYEVESRFNVGISNRKFTIRYLMRGG